MLTPTLRMASFLPEAIDSVLAQAHGALDYRVLDAASDDGTVDILKRYDNRLKWRSQPDLGAAAALKEGFAASDSAIFGWLNADDILLPGALESALAAFAAHPGAVAVYSGARWIDVDGHPIGPYPVAPDAEHHLADQCLICQPACFFRAEAYRACGGIDASLKSAFDYDLWIRLSHLGHLIHVPGCWALSRMHASNKTLGERRTMFREGAQLLHRHFGYVPFHWVYCSRLHRRDGRDQFFKPAEPSLSAYLLSLPAGLAENRIHPLRYLRQWAGQVTWNGFKRQFGLGPKP